MSSTFYFRITRDWAQVAAKSEIPSYISNNSGTPVEFFLSSQYVANALPTTINAKTYVAGGSIGTICVNNQYLYARALTESDDDIVSVIVSDKPTSDSEIEEQASRIDELLTEVIKLTQRVNEDELMNLRDRFSYFKLMRYIVKQNLSFEQFLATLSTNQSLLFNKLLGVELFIINNKENLRKIENRLTKVETKLTELVGDDLVRQINNLVIDMAEVNAVIDGLTPILNDVNNVASEAIKPVSNTLSALNNTIAEMAIQNDENKILGAKDKLLALYEDTCPDVVPVINSLADHMCALCKANLK